MFHNYYAVREWLESFIPLVYGKEELGLARIENLLGKLGNPQNKFKSIHVAGTSGKGSTCWYIAKLLEQGTNKSVILGSETTPESSLFVDSGQSQNDKKGLKIGLHISPHLVDIRERMQIFQKPETRNPLRSRSEASQKPETSLMPMGRFLRLFGEIRPVVEKIKKTKPDLTPSYFEILVAASFKYFAEEKVDWAVVEVGLGGRLDATNVLQSRIAVITNIGLDHTEILGKTIEKIAWEKAGIIKGMKGTRGTKSTKGRGVPVVTGATGKALEVIKKVAKEKGSDVYTISTQDYKNSLLKQINPAQVKNAVLALKTIEVLYSSRYPALRERKENREVTAFSLRHPEFVSGSKEGSRYTRTIKRVLPQNFPGRFEEIQPGVILDGAHNPNKINALIDFVISNFHFSQENLLEASFPISNKISSLRAKREVSFKNIKESSHSVRTINGVVLVVGFKKGKDWKRMIDLLVNNLPIKKVIATQFWAVTDTGRFAAVEPEEIARYMKSVYSLQSTVYSNSQEAVFEAMNHSSSRHSGEHFDFAQCKLRDSRISGSWTSQDDNKSDLALVTGSLYLVGEVRTMWDLPTFA